MARNFNFDQISDGFKMPAEGKHVFEITGYEEKEPSKGNPMDIFEVESQTDGGTAKVRLVYTEKTLWLYKIFFKACGMKTEGEKTIDMEKLIGRTFVATVTHTKNRVADAVTGDFKDVTYCELSNFEKDEDDDF